MPEFTFDITLLAIVLIVYILIVEVENKRLYKLAEKQNDLLKEGTDLLEIIYKEYDELKKEKKKGTSYKE